MEGEQIVIVTRTCPVCDRNSVLHVNDIGFNRWLYDGEHIQVALPDLSPDDRELLMTGTHPACWELFAGELE